LTLLVCLGATAAQAIVSRDFRITEQRGEVLPAEGDRPPVLATFHPSAILRARTPEDRERSKAALIADLSIAATFVEAGPPAYGRRPSLGTACGRDHEARDHGPIRLAESEDRPEE
jgi:hypothetical protein